MSPIQEANVVFVVLTYIGILLGGLSSVPLIHDIRFGRAAQTLVFGLLVLSISITGGLLMNTGTLSPGLPVTVLIGSARAAGWVLIAYGFNRMAHEVIGGDR